MLAGFVALGAGALMSMPRGFTQGDSKPGMGKIDVHYHVFPPQSLSATKNPAIKQWTVQRAIEDMDRYGIATTIASRTSNTVKEVREFNEFATQIGRDHPRRFGLFAALPLPEIDASLKEIEYALDVLKADGFGLTQTMRVGSDRSSGRCSTS